MAVNRETAKKSYFFLQIQYIYIYIYIYKVGQIYIPYKFALRGCISPKITCGILAHKGSQTTSATPEWYSFFLLWACVFFVLFCFFWFFFSTKDFLPFLIFYEQRFFHWQRASMCEFGRVNLNNSNSLYCFLYDGIILFYQSVGILCISLYCRRLATWSYSIFSIAWHSKKIRESPKEMSHSIAIVF